MTNRERLLAILNRKEYDRLPIIHFGFWNETIEKWVVEGHLTRHEGDTLGWNGVAKKLGFDSNLNTWAGCKVDLFPVFEEKLIRTLADGSEHYMQDDGVIVLRKKEAGSIPAEIAHTLTDRESWEEHYKPRLQFSLDRIDVDHIKSLIKTKKKTSPCRVTTQVALSGKFATGQGLRD